MAIADEIERLQNMLSDGSLTPEEFKKAKEILLNSAGSLTGSMGSTGLLSPDDMERETRLWGMFLHLSILLGYVLPLAGLIVPIVIWQIKKAELPAIDEHGKNAVNWMITFVIYVVACIVLSFLIIGIPLLIVLMVLAVVFPIMAGIKANQGEVWKYPMTITFLS